MFCRFREYTTSMHVIHTQNAPGAFCHKGFVFRALPQPAISDRRKIGDLSGTVAPLNGKFRRFAHPLNKNSRGLRPPYGRMLGDFPPPPPGQNSLGVFESSPIKPSVTGRGAAAGSTASLHGLRHTVPFGKVKGTSRTRPDCLSSRK